jgi:hypothetical protein
MRMPSGGGTPSRQAAPPTVELPTVNLLVRLIGPGGAGAPAGFPSRIEDIAAPGPYDPVSFKVAAPVFPGDLLEPERSDGWLLTWLSERGRWELPVSRVDCPRGTGPRCWWLMPAGQLRRNQRRNFYRVSCTVTVRVDVGAGDGRTVVGRTLDISEGGLRCLLPVTGLDVGVPVLAHLELDGVPYPLPGVVHRSLRPARSARVSGRHREVAIAFDDPEAGGNGLRRALARLQLRGRRTMSSPRAS